MGCKVSFASQDQDVWDVEKWKQALVDLSGAEDEEEVEMADTSGVGMSGAKDVVENDEGRGAAADGEEAT